MGTRRADGMFLSEGQQPRNPERPMCPFESKGRKKSQRPSLKAGRRKSFFLTWGTSAFFLLLRLLVDEMRPTHVRESNPHDSFY